MNSHLSQDQLSMWLLGRSTAEEEKHGRECLECRAHLARFQEPVSTYRNVMHEWSDRERIPELDEVSVLLRRPPAFLSSWRRWAVAGLAVMLLAAIRGYKQEQVLTQRAETVEEPMPS